MLDEAVLAIVTGAVANAISHLSGGRLDALRTRFVRIFRHGTEQQQSTAIRALEEGAAALGQQTASEADISARLTALLVSYLAAHPEAREDIEALASAPIASKTTNIGSQHNYSSGTFIGGDNYGGINSPKSQES
ncbi:hypothetical protein [Streptomyces sp. 6N223]|uniref:hypothetical protein n=1 Tax=Streptomyces sp. 6N223 TaxID=3457412 RepID=UPI003FD1B9A2